VRAAAFLLVCFPILASCSNPEPKTPKKSDEVPANSLDDAKLHDSSKPEETKDPTQPLTQKVGDAPSDSAAAPASTSAPASGSSGGGGGGKPNPNAASKAECDKAMDKYLSLEIATNPQLKGVPPEVIEQAKQMAREQHGEAPCTATKAQYKCAMAATSVGAWQKCMK
jgi:hypothetical protein